MTTLITMDDAVGAIYAHINALEYERDVLRKKLREAWLLVPRATRDGLDTRARREFERAMSYEVKS